jgi:hypothetical protein
MLRLPGKESLNDDDDNKQTAARLYKTRVCTPPAGSMTFTSVVSIMVASGIVD